MRPERASDPKVLRALIRRWARRWSVPGLEDRIRVKWSARFRSSLGRCAQGSREIRIASFLVNAPDALLREVLCHELAHAAVYERYGRTPRPHGSEWRTLMHAAGFEPRVRLPAALVEALPPLAARPRGDGALWEHRCPVCHTLRLARRQVPRWRCAACREVGLDGRLLVTRLPGRARSAR